MKKLFFMLMVSMVCFPLFSREINVVTYPIPKMVESSNKGVFIDLVKSVAKKAAAIAKKVKAGVEFVKEAAMLHDIGMFLTDMPKFGCYGKEPYIKHGILGKEILDKEGYPKHGLVCERHIGVGITKEEVIKKGLPLPKRDMFPETVEEEIVAYADKFFSKGKTEERSVEAIRKNLSRFWGDKVKKFEEWHSKFS